MNKRKLELMTYECQTGMYFSGIKQLKNGFIVYSDIVEDQGWNFFTGFKVKTIEQFENAYNSAKEYFSKMNRKPCFVIAPMTKISKEVKKHIQSNYSCFSTAVTLFANKFLTKKELSNDYSFRRIDNKTEGGLFVDTFKTSTTQTLPDDTYSSLPEYYFEALQESFSSKSIWKFVHYISLYENKPIGMVTACIKGNYCGLYGGGTFVKFRGKGVFTNLLNYVYSDLKKENIKYFFGMTEKGSNNEKYYNNLSWETVFDNEYYY